MSNSTPTCWLPHLLSLSGYTVKWDKATTGWVLWQLAPLSQLGKAQTQEMPRLYLSWWIDLPSRSLIFFEAAALDSAPLTLNGYLLLQCPLCFRGTKGPSVEARRGWIGLPSGPGALLVQSGLGQTATAHIPIRSNGTRVRSGSPQHPGPDKVMERDTVSMPMLLINSLIFIPCLLLLSFTVSWLCALKVQGL